MIEIEEGTDNVYADLHLADASEMLVKARLASKICSIIKARQLTQLQAAELLGLSQPKVSALTRGKFRGISESKMIDCLARLGRDIQIVVKEAPDPARRPGGSDFRLTLRTSPYPSPSSGRSPRTTPGSPGDDAHCCVTRG
jgi:predicted XRE-type DNA-binding protein